MCENTYYLTFTMFYLISIHKYLQPDIRAGYLYKVGVDHSGRGGGGACKPANLNE